MLTIFDFTKIDQYSQNVWITGLIAVGLSFFILGWVMTKILRPSNREIQQESHNIKKQLLDDLNSSKKFNADYQLLAKNKIEQDRVDNQKS